jgi:hypothetical protein
MNHDLTVIAPQGEAGAAVRAVGAPSLRVLDRGWASASGEHRLGAVTAPGRGIVAVADARIVAREELGEFLTNRSNERLRAAADAARAWLAEQALRCPLLRVIPVTAVPASRVQVVTGNVVPAEVG